MSQAAPGVRQAIPLLVFSLRDDRSPVGSRPQARGEGAPLPPAPGPHLALTHSLHAGARVWAKLSAPLSSVPSGSEGRGLRGLQGALTERALKTESTGQEKRLESVPPPSASANQRQGLAGCSTSAPSPPWPSRPARSPPRVRNLGLRCAAQTSDRRLCLQGWKL